MISVPELVPAARARVFKLHRFSTRLAAPLTPQPGSVSRARGGERVRSVVRDPAFDPVRERHVASARNHHERALLVRRGGRTCVAWFVRWSAGKEGHPSAPSSHRARSASNTASAGWPVTRWSAVSSARAARCSATSRPTVMSRSTAGESSGHHRAHTRQGRRSIHRARASSVVLAMRPRRALSI